MRFEYKGEVANIPKLEKDRNINRVYAVKIGNRYKIGSTWDISQRFSQLLQPVKWLCGISSSDINCVISPLMKKAGHIEFCLQELQSEYLTSGEYFEGGFEELLERWSDIEIIEEKPSEPTFMMKKMKEKRKEYHFFNKRYYSPKEIAAFYGLDTCTVKGKVSHLLSNRMSNKITKKELLLIFQPD